MNYYILPKNNTEPNINYTFIKHRLLKPYISRSLVYFFNSINEQIVNYDINVVNYVKTFINTYQFIYTNVPDTNISVSKVKVDSNIFYDLIEIFYICNLTESLNSKPNIVTMHFTPNYNSCCYFLNIIREDKDDIYINEDFDIEKIKLATKRKNVNGIANCDFLLFEFKTEHYQNISQYFANMIYTLDIIINHQNIGGISIIKVDNIYYKLIIDVLYILSGLFEKIYLIKPSISNSISSERYIICKHFVQINHNYHETLKKQLSSLIKTYNKNNEFIVNSLLHNSIPYYFINKIEESNAVIGQTQLENMMLIINTIKNRNKEDKIELMKRHNIQKCILWCEKYKIPHNKFIDKTNIFLHIKPNEHERRGNEAENINLDITDVETTFDLDLHILLQKEADAQIEIYEETVEYIDIETIVV